MRSYVAILELSAHKKTENFANSDWQKNGGIYCIIVSNKDPFVGGDI
jgi:hypothetical protein